jgi:hypothetical protein
MNTHLAVIAVVALCLSGCADLPASFGREPAIEEPSIKFTFEASPADQKATPVPKPPSPGPSKPGPSPTPLPEPAAGPIVPIQPFPIPERTELPEIAVDVWFGPRCPPCDRLMSEMKKGNGRRRIAWTWRDHSFPAASIVDGEARIPYIEWTARGTRWNFRGFITREELEARIARTESGR